MNKNAFKVGDKVRLTNDNRYAYVKVGDIATVTSVEDHGCMLHCGPDYLREHEGNKEGYHYFFFEGQFELVKEPTPMTNYNDGQIHGWNGGDCPVHPETMVKFWVDGKVDGECRAGKLRWEHKEHAGDIIAFRVVKEYVEPARPAASKVIWVNEHEDGYHTAHNTEEKAKHSARYSRIIRIAVKYVEAIADAKECKE